MQPCIHHICVHLRNIRENLRQIKAGAALIARKPKALCGAQSARSHEIRPQPRTKPAKEEKIARPINQQPHTNRRHQSDFPYDFLLIKRQNPLPNVPQPHIYAPTEAVHQG
jgi:hypothetical protein